MSVKNKYWLKFLGTAGARFVMIRQLRASGGIWVRCENTNVLIDPGPGSLVRCAEARPKLDPTSLDAVILTHRHLDHANDVNVMIEAMTEGGFKKRGEIFVPQDAVSEDPVVLKYEENLVGHVDYLRPQGEYRAGDFEFQVPQEMLHPAQTYGLKFKLGARSVSLVADTAYWEGLEEVYQAEVMIINVVFYERRPGIQHLCFEDVRRIVSRARPRKAVMTHFGLSMLKAGPAKLARQLTRQTGVPVVAATDGLILQF